MRYLMAIFAAGLVLTGGLRWATRSFESMSGLSGLPTPLYVALTVIVVVRLVRSPIGWAGIGFNVPFRPVRHVALGLAAAAAVVLAGELLTPLWIALFEGGRDLSRFEATVGTLPGLIGLLVFSWLFAAFGEELAFRGALMRGLASVLDGGRGAILFAYFLQAIIFALVHVYQGPAGVAGTFVSGLIYGGVVLIAGGSLWPAMLAHGFSNSYGLISLWLQANPNTAM